MLRNVKLSKIFFAALFLSCLSCVFIYATYNLGTDIFYYRFNLIIYLISIVFLILVAIISGISFLLLKRRMLSFHTFKLVKAVSIFVLGTCLGFFVYTIIHPFSAAFRYNLAKQMLPELIHDLYEYKLVHQNYPPELYKIENYSFIDRVKLSPLQYLSKDNYKSVSIILFIDSNRIYCELSENATTLEKNFDSKESSLRFCRTSPRGY